MKLTEKTLKKMIVETMTRSGYFKATAPTLRDPDPLDDIFEFIDAVGDAALEKMGRTFDDFAPGNDLKYSKLTNQIVYRAAGDIKKAAGKMGNDELLSILQGLMPMLVDAVINDKRVKALFPREEEPNL